MVLIYCVQANEFWLVPPLQIVEETLNYLYDEGASMVVRFEMIILTIQCFSQTVLLEMSEERLN